MSNFLSPLGAMLQLRGRRQEPNEPIAAFASDLRMLARTALPLSSEAAMDKFRQRLEARITPMLEKLGRALAESIQPIVSNKSGIDAEKEEVGWCSKNKVEVEINDSTSEPDEVSNKHDNLETFVPEEPSGQSSTCCPDQSSVVGCDDSEQLQVVEDLITLNEVFEEPSSCLGGASTIVVTIENHSTPTVRELLPSLKTGALDYSELKNLVSPGDAYVRPMEGAERERERNTDTDGRSWNGRKCVEMWIGCGRVGRKALIVEEDVWRMGWKRRRWKMKRLVWSRSR
uniref:UPF0053 inner membrane protein ytfL n=1 Tax=Lygus hesperus TaxID=30085 RepID=A0A0A9YWB3_LYGHE